MSTDSIPQIAYRQLGPQHRTVLADLATQVVVGLERRDFYVPLTDESIDEMVDPQRAVAYGAFDGEELVGTAQLYLGDSLVEEVARQAGLQGRRVAELGGALVLATYRRRGIMSTLARLLVGEARDAGYDYVVSTAHPDNVASQRGLLSCGETLVATGTVEGLPRNIYAMSLS